MKKILALVCWTTFAAKIGVLKHPEDIVVTPFGLFLQEIRRDRKLAQKQLAGLLDVDQSYLTSLYIHGHLSAQARLF